MKLMSDIEKDTDLKKILETRILDSRNITTMKTPIGLVRMCTLPQGVTNSVAHMMNAMNKVLHEYIRR